MARRDVVWLACIITVIAVGGLYQKGAVPERSTPNATCKRLVVEPPLPFKIGDTLAQAKIAWPRLKGIIDVPGLYYDGPFTIIVADGLVTSLVIHSSNYSVCGVRVDDKPSRIFEKLGHPNKRREMAIEEGARIDGLVYVYTDLDENVTVAFGTMVNHPQYPMNGHIISIDVDRKRPEDKLK